MRTPNGFWLCVHELARAFDDEGRTDERRRNIVDSLSQMPAIARGRVMAELVELVELLTFLPDLYPHVADDALGVVQLRVQTISGLVRRPAQRRSAL